MEANGGGQGVEYGEDHELGMVVSSQGMVAWVPPQAVARNGGRDALAAAAAQNAWVPAEAAARTGWIPAPWMLVLEGYHALAVALRYGWIRRSLAVEFGWIQGAAPPPRGTSAATNMVDALYLAFFRFPAQEIARCRTVCRLWREITAAEDFRRYHHDHHYRNPMPLFFFQDSDTAGFNLRAIDIRNRVSRPVIRFARSPSHEVPRIHGSCAGILLLSSGDRLYAFNPCTRRWARLPPLHVGHDIIGFYVTSRGGFGCHVLLYNDGGEEDLAAYWIFTLGTEAPRCIDRPGPVDPDGIASTYSILPFFFLGVLHWLPRAAQDNRHILTFDTPAETFFMFPHPSIEMRGEDVRQLFEIDQHLAMTVISPATAGVDVWVNIAELWSRLFTIRLPVDAINLDGISPTTAGVDVWVRSNIAELWCRRLYSIRLPVDVINLDGSSPYNVGMFDVAQDPNDLVQCRRILLQCDAMGAVLEDYQLADHYTLLSGHTIQESLLLHPSILPMQDSDAVDGDPPFFENQ